MPDSGNTNFLSRKALACLHFILFGVSFFFYHDIYSQNIPRDLNWVDHVHDSILADQHIDSQKKSDLADSAFLVAQSYNDICRQVRMRIKQATYLDNMGLADSALTQLYWANESFDVKCDSALLMDLFCNLTNVYLSLNELSRVDSVGRIAMTHWNPSWKEKENRFAIMNNMAIAAAMQEDFITATRVFHQTYKEAVQAGDELYIQRELINLGSIKGMTGDPDSAYHFFRIAANNAKANADMENYIALLINMADNERERGNPSASIALLDTAFTLAGSQKNLELSANVQKHRANLFAGMNDYQKAYEYLTSFIEMREQYLDEERVKAVTEMLEKYESEKKARQIQQLEVEKLDAELANERVTNTRNRYLYIGAGVVLVAIGLWSRLIYVRRSKTALQKEKDISEGLLLNILPESVAAELKSKGYAEARHSSPVTVLFSDFKGFTTVSEELTPAELVEELNVCFRTFDEIMMRYGIEKIKTIGDAYMAAGNIPDTNTSTPVDVVNAGLDMQQFVKTRKEERTILGLPAFDMRVGVHSGPVVAGIVGVKKFQYDLWGDTVNTASRMESHGEIGRVNISDATYQLVKDSGVFEFESRGMVHVKGKRDQLMYFVLRKSDVTEVVNI